MLNGITVLIIMATLVIILGLRSEDIKKLLPTSSDVEYCTPPVEK